MFYSSVLYYPHIFVQDVNWLKNALLFWDQIHTIVPSSYWTEIEEGTISLPNNIRMLIDEGVLVPLIIDNNHSAVIKATETFINQELKNYKNTSNSNELAFLYSGKVSPMLQSVSEIYPSLAGKIMSVESGGESFVAMPEDLAYSYMNILSTQLAAHRHLALATDDEQNEKIIFRRFEDVGITKTDENYVSAYLVNLFIESLNVQWNKIDSIVKFRNKHMDELSLFRAALGNNFSNIPDGISGEGLGQYFRDYSKNELEPQISNLQKSLKGNGLKTVGGLFKTAAFCTPTSLFGLVSGGPLGMALGTIAGLSISLAIEGIDYCINRNEKVQNNPYSYVLQLRKRAHG